MDFGNNEQLKFAYEFVQYTNKNIFLTGKAGTGKTTFLKNLKYSTPKRMVVVAPTGVAAINAGGVTIHSFFQLPFSPFVPNESERTLFSNKSSSENKEKRFTHKLNRNKIKLIRSLDLLVIDEISMVRADLLDAIDDVLRRYRHNSNPFGGLQVLMIGDLNQLVPVIKPQEWSLVSDYYKNVYFFSSIALQKTGFTTIELKHIYRQEDKKFIKLLGEIRDNKISEKSYNLLNSRYLPGFNPDENEGYITLTTHNVNAAEINGKKLDELKTKEQEFSAVARGDFPEYMYPTEENLKLKEGAQVMFIKNDSSYEKLYYNGKIGKITRIDNDVIIVECETDTDEIEVRTETWENVKYQLNAETKEIEEEKVGSFEQYPLKLSWAITVHKSQGLTFEKAVIDVNKAFAFGQVYVALSRCKTLEGLVLVSKVSAHSIKSDFAIHEFNDYASKNEPDDEELDQSKLNYQKDLILELFDFSDIKIGFYSVRKIYKQNAEKFNITHEKYFEETSNLIVSEIINVNEKFRYQLSSYFTKNAIPNENIDLQERIKKAIVYFNEKVNSLLVEPFKKMQFDSDNKELKSEIKKTLERFELSLVVKTTAFENCANGFETIAYLNTVANAEIDFKPSFNKKNKHAVNVASGILHKDLYVEINVWRKSISEDYGIDVYRVLPQKTLKLLVELLPQNISQLKEIKGFGKVKTKQYGEDILDIINTYCEQNEIYREQPEPEPTKTKKKKTDTKLVSLQLFKQGLTLDEIAKERDYVESTIFTHISYFVLNGELEANALIEEGRLNKIKTLVSETNTTSLSGLVSESNGEFSYSELRFVRLLLANSQI